MAKTTAVELLSGVRQSGESSKAIQACNDFLRLGPGRSLTALRSKYTESNELRPPTSSEGSLKHWSAEYGWMVRAEEFDGQQEEIKNQRRREAMEAGLALDYERVLELKRLTAFLSGQVYEQGVGGQYHNVWVPDVKQIGSGEYAERVDIERFNGAIIEQLRGALDDLAKETGGRKASVEMTGAKGAPLFGKVVFELLPPAEAVEEEKP